MLMYSCEHDGIPFIFSLIQVSNLISQGIYGPRREKTCLQGFCQSEFQTDLLSYRDYLGNWNFTCTKFTYATFQKANNKGADQIARMRRLVWACFVRKYPKTGFLATRALNNVFHDLCLQVIFVLFPFSLICNMAIS